MRMKSIKFKILRSTTLCVLIITLISNLTLYNYLGGIITKKSSETKLQFAQILKQQLNQYFEEIVKLGVLCASDVQVRSALKDTNSDSVNAKRKQYDAKMKMCSILATSMISPYVNRLIVFNETSVLIEANTKHYGALDTKEKLWENIVEKKLKKLKKRAVLLQENSLAKPDEKTLIYCGNIDMQEYGLNSSYVYVEVDPSLIYSLLAVYEQLDSVAITSEDKSIFFTLSEIVTEDNMHVFSQADNEVIKYNNSSYKVVKTAIDYYG